MTQAMTPMITRVMLVLGTSAGGVGRHVRMLAAGLAREGAETVVAGPAATEAAFGFSEAGARFLELEVSDRPHPASDLRSILRLRAAARGAHVVHAHGLRAGALAALALIGLSGRPRLVVTLHNAVTAGGLIGAVYGVLERIVATRADHVLVVSPDLGDRVRALGARRIGPAVVPAPPLEPPLRSRAEVHEEILKRFGGSPSADRPIVLTIARLAQQKGLETLLDVAASGATGGAAEEARRGPRVRRPEHDSAEEPAKSPAKTSSPDSGPDAGAGSGAHSPERTGRDPLFVIAGDGPGEADLRARIDAEGLPVLLYGWARPADLLQVAAALLVPSRWEGQPLSVQEALQAGCPIVATRVGGIPDLVRDAALLVPPGDAEAMRGELARLLGDEGLAERLGEASARRGKELPGEEEALRSVLAVYGGLIKP